MEKPTRTPSTTDSDTNEDSAREKDVELGEPLAPASSMPGVPAIVPPPEPQAGNKGPGPIPDGGLEAWLQVVGSWCVLLASWGLVNTYGVYRTYYETDLLK